MSRLIDADKLIKGKKGRGEMKEFVEKLIGRLEEEKHIVYEFEHSAQYEATQREVVDYEDIIEIVNELAEEYNNGWIPCSERLPEERDSVFAKLKGTSKWKDGMFEKTSDDVNVTIEYKDDTRKTLTTHTVDGKWKKDYFADWEVIAWQPLPEPYKPQKEAEWKNKVMKHFTNVE